MTEGSKEMLEDLVKRMVGNLFKVEVSESEIWGPYQCNVSLVKPIETKTVLPEDITCRLSHEIEASFHMNGITYVYIYLTIDRGYSSIPIPNGSVCVDLNLIDGGNYEFKKWPSGKQLLMCLKKATMNALKSIVDSSNDELTKLIAAS